MGKRGGGLRGAGRSVVQTSGPSARPGYTSSSAISRLSDSDGRTNSRTDTPGPQRQPSPGSPRIWANRSGRSRWPHRGRTWGQIRRPRPQRLREQQRSAVDLATLRFWSRYTPTTPGLISLGSVSSRSYRPRSSRNTLHTPCKTQRFRVSWPSRRPGMSRGRSTSATRVPAS